MNALVTIAWWYAVGLATMTWLLRPVRNWTWGTLATAVAFAQLGPLLTAGIAFKVVVEAEFWRKRIFGGPS